jgi:hypothetical protein
MAKANQVSIPYLDPNVQHVGISRLRALNVTQLSELDKTLVIQDNDKPLAVLLKYEHFLAMQEQILAHEGEIGAWLSELEHALERKDGPGGKRIRERLRKLGHYGGLGNASE